ncbi:ROK family transcriptional regulator [Herbiconiux ginsengi]|uniref:Sugar kinase of the NBD/HSP70 family, may contain an N-terminal HTH domain n=1 Tax=Herbiconiux ginsengi TaxID=381665 RepID=A0A1H3MTC3_9MICO|nr:ROK family transcriptional regulator [Herbiconiux ginsengi]SDY79813.1 Sugar kinase of the NBD/HSP70 family, may contain an N-terminal HTH domain [Herbiconiux ginsengi]
MAESTGSELRRTNLSAVLTLVHSRGAVTRAELTRETGLNRSTVGALVGELVDLRLVRESEAAARHVGRPSLMIEPERRTVALSVHPTPDAVTIGLVGLGGHVIKRIRYGTVQVPRPDEVVNIVSAVVAGMRSELDASYRTVGVGLAVPGLVRSRDGLVDAALQLGWHAEPLAERLEQTLGLPVFAGGEAAAGALAESAFGVARQVRNLVFLTGGAGGVSAAVIGDGALLTGTDGYAGALGHTLVNSDGALCRCGARGCLDTEVGPDALLATLAAPGAGVGAGVGAGFDLDAAMHARRDDPDLIAVVHRQLDHLAVAVRTAVNLFDPELLVLGGYLGGLHAFAPERLPAALARSAMRAPGSGVRIAQAGLGDDLLMVGAAQLALTRVLRDPAGLATRTRPAM